MKFHWPNWLTRGVMLTAGHVLHSGLLCFDPLVENAHYGITSNRQKSGVYNLLTIKPVNLVATRHCQRY